MRELTEFLEDEGFYSDEEKQVKISISLKELKVIIDGLKKVKFSDELHLREYEYEMEEEDIAELQEDIKFVESLHSDLVQTLNLELENVI